MQISSHGQELDEDDVPPTQIGSRQQHHKLDQLFPSVRHVEVLAHVRVYRQPKQLWLLVCATKLW